MSKLNIDYSLVSEAAILRDFVFKPGYINEEHEKLVDIADTLYNANIPVEEWNDNPDYDYKALYYKYGKEFFKKVLSKMADLDEMTRSGAEALDLAVDYNDSILQMKEAYGC